MIDGHVFKSLHEFYMWYMSLNPQDEMDMEEAMTIYFNLETYEECI